MGTLVLKLGTREIASLGITKTRTSIGRDPSCDLAIDNDSISRRHAFVDFEDGAFRIYDNGSVNGLFVGVHRVREVALAHGAKVRLGKFTLIFLDVGGAPPERLAVTPLDLDGSEAGGPTQHLDEGYMLKMRAALEDRERGLKSGAGGATRPITVPAPVPRKSPAGLLLLVGALIGAAAVAAGLYFFGVLGGG